MNSEEYIESLMHEADDYAKFVTEHWSRDLLDKPGALVAVIETKIARAELAERRRIVELLISEELLDPNDEHGQAILELINEGGV